MVMPLSLRMLLRDWRAGELRVLAAALLLAVAGITAVGFFADRMRLALELQASDLLGADLAVTSAQPLRPELAAVVPAHMRQASAVEFPSMAISAQGSALASIRAVSADYPLRGELRIGEMAFGPDRVAQSAPAPGTVWLEPRLLGQLHVEVGDAVTLGDAEFRVAAVLTGEPLAGSSILFSVAPRLMLALDDLESTGLIQPASRVRYRYLYAGSATEVAALRAAFERLHVPGEQIQGVEDAQPQTRQALERARAFLSLAALVSVLLAGVAIAMSTRRFIARHLDGCAVMRCLGARGGTLLKLYGLQLLWLGLAAAIVGSVVGYVAQYGLERIIGSMMAMSLPAPSLYPLIPGVATALIALLGFALPPLLHLRQVPALHVLRRELGATSTAGMAVYVGGAAAMIALVLWFSPAPRMGLFVLLGALLTLVALAGLGVALLAVLRVVQPHLGAVGRMGVLGLLRRPAASVIQLMAFGLGLTVLLLLVVVRADLLAAWERGLPHEAPNRFLINVQPTQIDALHAFFAERSIETPALLPMVRGRLIAIDSKAIDQDSYEEERARDLVRREFNLSWAEAPQNDNRIVAGQWWAPDEQGTKQVSVEQGLAQTLHIKLGDRLTFDIAGTPIEVEVSSLRAVEWDSFRVNFFVIAPPGVFDAYPASYISSLYVAPGEYRVLDELVRLFPNVTVIDVAAIMERVRAIMERVTAAVEFVFVFTLLAGLLVMYAAVHATLDERIRETVLMRTLGASRRQLLRVLIVEFTGLGLLSGLAAATMAALLGFVVSSRVLDLAYAPGAELWLIGALAGAVGVGVAGVLGTRFVLAAPPVRVLREAL
ncbi:MAG: ABC transporter permease [Chromatiales bacterium]|jgi:putative ABC transport system permease protein|nr:ABC transporter permease [Chromatiales bacterium]